MKNTMLGCVLTGLLGFGFGIGVDAQVSSSGRMWRYDLAQSSSYPGIFPFPVTMPLKWTADASASTSPVIANGNAYVGYGAQLRSYNAIGGALNWTWTPPAGEINGYSGLPAIGSNGLIYFTWNYFVTGQGRKTKIYCLNATTKAQVWTFDAGFTHSSGKACPIAVFDNRVFAVIDNGFVYCLDVATGALKWNFNIGTFVDETGPAIAGNTLYVAPVGKLYAFNTTTGAVKWSRTVPGWTQSSPAVDSNTVYLCSNDGKLHAYDVANGAVRWEFNTGKWVNAWRSSPAVVGNTVIIGSGDDINKVFWINATTGAATFTYTASGKTWASSPAASFGMVFITTVDPDAKVLAIQPGNRPLQWSAQLGTAWSRSSPAIFTNRVYVCGHSASNGMQKLHMFER
jgi:eukaryotic-like serine/threonine-protein kinase